MMDAAPMNGHGASQPTPNGTGPPVKRKVKKVVANPFRTARKPGTMIGPNGQQHPQTVRAAVPLPPGLQQPGTVAVASLNSTSHSGFSDPAVRSGARKFTDFKLVATKKDLLDGLRFHILHLADDNNENKKVDIRDPAQFPQPAHLHRRDPRNTTSDILKDEQLDIKDGMNAEERKAVMERNEVRKQERAANLAQIAPTQTARKMANQKLKTKAVYKRDYTEEDKRRIQTNYEEKLPWHLEDFDNKHCLVGENQAPAAHRHVAFIHESTADSQIGRFRLVPVEKVYDFYPQRKQRKEMTIEQAEAAMKRRVVAPEWLEKYELDKQKQRKEALSNKSSLFTGENKSNKGAGRTGDDADWDNDDDDLFADDEEGPTEHVKDEDEAIADKRIKEDQLKANFFDVKEEQEYDREEEEERKEEQLRKENFKNVKKLLEKHEHNYNHASDSEYSFSSDDEEDEEERARLEAEKQKNLENAQLQPDDTSGKVAGPPSGGTTPSGRKENASGILSDREGTASKPKRKRPDSPNLSAADSGTDTSSRNKKPKMKHSSSTQSLSRPDAPLGTKLKIRGGNSATSDMDAANTSDSAARRHKLKNRTASGIPSRAASPAQGTSTNLPSRSGAASPLGASSPTSSTPSIPMPSLDTIRVAIQNSMPDGMTVPEFVASVPHPKERKQEILQMTLSIAKMETRTNSEGKVKKVLVLK